MLTLYHAPRSRSSRFIWLLEELGMPYEIKVVSIRRGDGSGVRDPQNPHPHGKVPAITHDGALVFESCAVASYLTWLAYYAGVLEPAFTSKFMKIDVPRGTAGWVGVDEAMAHVGAALAAG